LKGRQTIGVRRGGQPLAHAHAIFLIAVQVQRTNILFESILKLVRRGAIQNALNLLIKLRPVDIAQVLDHLNRREREVTFQALARQDVKKAAGALSEMEAERAAELIMALDRDGACRLLQELHSDDAATILAELPEGRREEMLEAMRAEQSTDVQELLGFAEETAGRLMNPHYFALEEHVTVAEAIEALQRRSEEFEMAFYLYVVDSRNHLLGVVSLRQLLLNPPSTPLRKIMISDVIKVTTDTDQEEVARIVATYNLLAVPVVDRENKLVGIITVDDIIDVMREEATEDIYALAGVEADDRALSSPIGSARRRLPWLLLSLGAALIAVVIVWYYLDTIQSRLALAALIPVIATMGGNAANQTMTVVIRAMGLGEFDWEASRRIVFKESLVGLINGLVVGLLVCTLISIWFDVALGAVAGATVLLSLSVAATIGTLIPIVLKRLHIDPALASSVFVIALTNVITLLLYLGLASFLLKRLNL
jgi:magnesium transporter